MPKESQSQLTTDVVFSTTTQLAAALRDRTISAVEVLDAHLLQIEKHNDAINAVVSLHAESARAQAQEADAALARDEVRGPLHGVPFVLKDAFATKGMRTTTGFGPFDHVPNEDSTVAARLKAAGAIIMAKSNVAELLADHQSINQIFGHTNNPWNVERTSGGSSGGAAAAVASGMTPFDIGTDLSSSIRLPAHFCGVFGLKPTERRVSLIGVVPTPQPPPRPLRIMSCLGPIARSVDDLAVLYTVIAGPDVHDSEVAPVPVDAPHVVSLSDLRVAIAPTLGDLPIASEIRRAVTELAEQLEPLCKRVDQALPQLDFKKDLERTGEIIGMALGAFQPEQKSATLAQYLTALHTRDQSIRAWETFFDDWDVLLCPPAMTAAFPHCEPGSPLQVDGREQDYWLVSAPGTLFNYSGHPAVVLPYDVDSDGLPIGVQLVGKRWSESRLLGIAQALTAVTQGFQRPPEL